VKKTQNQSGFAHLMVVTTVLALAVIGLLGFVFWQNFIQPKTDSAKSGSSTVDDKSKTTPSTNTPAVTTDANKDYLVLDDWGVKFKLPTNLGNNQIKYYQKTNTYSGDRYYEFSTSRVEALGGACLSTDPSYTSLGALSRMTSPSTATASAPELASKIGDYYYYYSHPQAGCSDSNASIQLEDTNMMQSFLMSVEKK